MFHGGSVRRPFRSNGGQAFPIFSLPLTTSLIPNVATGSSTPTFSRASTAYVQDHEGIQREVLANEARFWGARRVANLLLVSENLASATWQTFAGATKVGAGPTTGLPAGATLSHEISWGATGGAPVTASAIFQNLNLLANNTYVASCWVKAVSTTTTIRATMQDPAGLYPSSGDVTVTPDAWTRISVLAPITISGVGNIAIRNNVAGTTANVYLTAMQVENVSGQSVTTAGEYISTGILATPFKGANVDGVQCFNTDSTGALIPSTTLLGYYSEPGTIAAANQVLQSNSFKTAPWVATDMTLTVGSVVAPTGASEATNVVEGVAGTAVLEQAAIAITANTNYVASIYVKKVSGFDWLLVRYTDPTGLGGVQGWVNLATGTAGTSGIFGVLVGTTFSRFIVYPLVNGWYRVVLAGVVDNVSVTAQLRISSASADASTTRVNNASWAAWAAQLELRHWNISDASSPIITGASVGTRSVDALSFSATGNFSNAEGSCYAEVSPFSSLVNGAGFLNQGPSSRELGIVANIGQSNRTIDGSGVLVTTVGGSTWTTRFQTKKGAGSWRASDSSRSVAFTGTTLATGTYSGDFSALTTLRINMNGFSSFGFPGCSRNVRIYAQKLADAQLNAMVV
jgi:hypothetical protein